MIVRASFTGGVLSGDDGTDFADGVEHQQIAGCRVGPPPAECGIEDQLLDEAVYHSEHLRLGLPERPDAVG
jgi:hypothetical protein